MLMPQQKFSAEAKNALAIFRAVALSRKTPATMKQLLRDYTELEGHGVNCRKFGYEHLEDFLVQSGEFIIHNMQGEMYLTARPSPESDHIRKMICLQKGPKRQAVLKFRKPQKSDMSWNQSSYSSNVYDKLPSPRKLPKCSPEKNNNNKTIQKKGDSNNNSNHSNRNAATLTQQQNQKSKNTSVSPKSQQQQQTKTASKQLLFSNNMKSTTMNLQERLQQFQKQMSKETKNNEAQQPVTLVPNNTQQQQQHDQQKQNSGENQHVQQQQLVVTMQRKPLLADNVLQQQQQQQQQQQVTRMVKINSSNVQEQNRRFSDETSSISMMPIGKGSIQERLKLAQKAKQSEPEKTTTATVTMAPIQMEIENIPTSSSSPSTTPIMPSLIFEFNPNLDAITSLSQYCTFKQYEQPVYKFIKSRVSPCFHGRVIINGATYSTYPDEFDTEFYAKLAAATKAIEEIQLQETRNRYPLCIDSDTEIALKIYEIIKNHKCGIFHKKITEIFELSYQKTLPDNWFSIIQESNMFNIEMTLGDNMIILAKEEIESSAASTASDSLDSDIIVVDRITLPWEHKYWNLYITYCASTTEIWGRIVDRGYNDKLDGLMNDIDVYMLTDKQRPISIICGQIYLLSIAECWHRVRVEEMNKEAGKCLCFFIDFGDEEWHPMEQLYICEMKFLTLPPQAICFSLFGLEDFAENPNAKKHLDTLNGRSLVAEILTKNCDENNSGNTKIQCVLYDTSTNEDINLNPLILNQICDDTQPPELKRTGVNNACITYVHRSGEIYLQIRNMELQYVQKLVQQLVESKFKKEQHKVNADDMKTTKLFFIQDPDDERWYRGSLTTETNDGGSGGRTQNPDGTYNIFYVDYGVIKSIPLSRIYRLDSLSAALSKFQRQAIKVKLYKIPPINDRVIGLIRGLLPAETPAIVKVVVNAIIPQVTVYKRFDDKGGLFNVNDSIQIEYELERCLSYDSNFSKFNNFSSSNEVINDTQSVTVTNTTSVTPTLISGRNDHESPMFDATTNLGPHSPINSMRSLSLRTQITLPNSPQKDLPKLLENIFIPNIGEYFDVIVTMASNPGNFMVRPYNDGPRLSEMMEELKTYCASNDEFIPGDMIEVGQAYAAYNSTDGYYYRVTVENIFKSMEIHIHYCDFGGVAVLSNDKLKTLPAKFRTLPKQAIAAKLSDLKPKHRDWTLQDCIRFQELTVKQKFVSIIKNITCDSVAPMTRVLELQLIDVQTDDDIFIDQILINEGRAIRISSSN